MIPWEDGEVQLEVVEANIAQQLHWPHLCIMLRRSIERQFAAV